MCHVCNAFRVHTDDCPYEEALSAEDAGGVTGGGEAAALPTLGADQVAEYLVNGYWAATGQIAHRFNVAAGGEMTVNITGLHWSYQAFARDALQVWTDISGIAFREVSTGGDLVFDDNEQGRAYCRATWGWDGITTGAFINIGSDWDDLCGDDYTHQTFLHEIGHALGLGHTGNYNGSASISDRWFANDSWQVSIMSYFSQSQNPDVAGPQLYTATAMPADIAAIHRIYGRPTDTNAGDSVYGENTNVSGGYAAMAAQLASNHVVTLFDSGGVDTLDLSGSFAAQRIDLNRGAMSDAYGRQNSLIIEAATDIENLITGAGNDVLTGNALANVLAGGAGDDALNGGAGDDRLIGGAGSDTLDGGTGNDTYYLDVAECVGGDVDTILSFGAGDRLQAWLGTAGAAFDGHAQDGAALVLRFISGALSATVRILDDVWDAARVIVSGDLFTYLADGTPDAPDPAPGPTPTPAPGPTPAPTPTPTPTATLIGTEARDSLAGTAGDDVIDARGGDDRISAGDGDDWLSGGDGDDVMTGGRGADTFHFEIAASYGGSVGAGAGRFFADPADAYLNFDARRDPIRKTFDTVETRDFQRLNIGSGATTVVVDDGIETLRLSGALTSLSSTRDGAFLTQTVAENIADGFGLHLVVAADLASGSRAKARELAIHDADGGLSLGMRMMMSIATAGGAVGAQNDFGLRLGAFDLTGEGMLEVLVDGRNATDILRFEGDLAHALWDQVLIANTAADTAFDEYLTELGALRALMKDFAPGARTDPLMFERLFDRETVSISVGGAPKSYVLTDAVETIRIGGFVSTTARGELKALDERAAIEAKLGLHIAAAFAEGYGREQSEIAVRAEDGALSAELKLLLAIAEAGGAAGGAEDLGIRLGSWSAGDETLTLYLDGRTGSSLVTLTGATAADALAYLSSGACDLAAQLVQIEAEAAADVSWGARKYLNFDQGERYDPAYQKPAAARAVQSVSLSSKAGVAVIGDETVKIRIAGRLTNLRDAAEGGFASQSLAENIADGFGVHVAATVDFTSALRDKAGAILVRAADGGLSDEMKTLLAIAAEGGDVGASTDLGLRLGVVDVAGEGILEILVDGRNATDILRLEGEVAQLAADWLAGDPGAILDRLQAEHDAISARIEGFAPGTLTDPFATHRDFAGERVTLSLTDGARSFGVGDALTTINLSGALTDLRNATSEGFAGQSMSENIADGWGVHAVAQLAAVISRSSETRQIAVRDADGGLAAEFKALLALADAGGAAGSDTDYGLRLELAEDGSGEVLLYVDGRRATDVLHLQDGLAADARAFLASAGNSVAAQLGVSAPILTATAAGAAQEAGLGDLLTALDTRGVTELELGFGHDVIADFRPGDRIEIATALGAATPLEVLSAGRNTVLKFGEARLSEIILKNAVVTEADIVWSGTTCIIEAPAAAALAGSAADGGDVFVFEHTPEGLGRHRLAGLETGDRIEIHASEEDFLGLHVADGRSVLEFGEADLGWTSRIALAGVALDESDLAWQDDMLVALI